tara:strand:- start:3313 stop:4245 length:933 start_codon:yes stop_codon:yes gene_type:complete
MDKQLRNYTNSSCINNVEKTYKTMLENQTIDYVVEKINDTFMLINPYQYNIWNIIEILDTITDHSDPDTSLPQIIHSYQTAESIRYNYIGFYNQLKYIPIYTLFSETEWNSLPLNIKQLYNTSLDKLYPHINDWSWLIVVGFIHDLGKILLLPQFGGLPQWSVVGDSFPLGLKLSSNYLYYNKNYHDNNPSLNLDTYLHRCGFNNIIFSWGHDEYLARTLEKNKTYLPKEAIYIIRYHSFYSWHTPNNGIRGYTDYASTYDWYMLPLLKCFQKADLYSKNKNIPNISHIKNTYRNLILKYIPSECINIFS